MKIGAVIPTRGDREKFLNHAKYLLSRQTLLPDVVEVVDDAPVKAGKDISWRYNLGVKRAVEKGCEVIFFWEDDDWYDAEYIRRMLSVWRAEGECPIFGLSTTWYYHLTVNKWRQINHPGRASAMSTAVTSEICDRLPKNDDDVSYFDIELWKMPIAKLSFSFDVPIAVGIKHGIGMCGGQGHRQQFNYPNSDKDMEWLKGIVDEVSFEFYRSTSQMLKERGTNG